MRNALLTGIVVALLAAPLAQAQDQDGEQMAQPTAPMPSAAPSAPGEVPPPPGADVTQAPLFRTPVGLTSGQWVFTQQYGWIWMPYGQQFTYVIDDGASVPYMFVYAPVFGWRWLEAPWVFGWGVEPCWGVYGPSYFAWYAHPWFHARWGVCDGRWGDGRDGRGHVGVAVGRTAPPVFTPHPAGGVRVPPSRPGVGGSIPTGVHGPAVNVHPGFVGSVAPRMTGSSVTRVASSGFNAGRTGFTAVRIGRR